MDRNVEVGQDADGEDQDDVVGVQADPVVSEHGNQPHEEDDDGHGDQDATSLEVGGTGSPQTIASRSPAP